MARSPDEGRDDGNRETKTSLSLNLWMVESESGALAACTQQATQNRCEGKSDGNVLTTDGPYLETTEQADGFLVLEAADLEDALVWGRKAAVACRAPVEVRPFHRCRTHESNEVAKKVHLERMQKKKRASASHALQ